MERLTELALKFKYENQAWTLLKNLDIVRPHYFWPLLMQNGKTNGEIGKCFYYIDIITKFLGMNNSRNIFHIKTHK